MANQGVYEESPLKLDYADQRDRSLAQAEALTDLLSTQFEKQTSQQVQRDNITLTLEAISDVIRLARWCVDKTKG